MILSNTKRFFKPAFQTIVLMLSCSIVSLAQSPQTYWWNDAVFYEVFVRSFKDNNGDGKGDLKGLIDKLDYLNDGNPSTHNDLGVTAIWLMPIQQSPSYHGYDVTDYRTVEQDYGTNQDFQDFITAAHSRGIKVIIDYVMNHTSSQHPWFIESASGPTATKRDWYRWQNTNPGTTTPWNTSPVWHPMNGSYYYGIFWDGMPDLNYSTSDVKDEMFDIARFWLEDMNVDGFRLDAVKYIDEDGTTLEDTPETIQFWKDFRTYYKSVKPDAFAVGEAWTSTDKVEPYVNSNGLDYCFEFDLAAAILNAANTGTTSALSTKIDEVITAYPFLQFGTFLTNHDMNRVANQLSYNVGKEKIAAGLLLTLPGVPYIYYGEEIGMTGTGVDENKRTPLQWNSTAKAGFTTGTPWRGVNSDYAGRNIESQQRDASSLWNNYRSLIAIRNNQKALRQGTYKALTASSASVISFLRQYQTENIVVVSNTSVAAVSGLQLSLDQGGIAQGTYTLVELQSGDQLPVTIDNNGSFSNLTIDVPPQTTLIYKLLDALTVNTSITFQIDMNDRIGAGDFNPAAESVDMVANFNHFGADSITILHDTDGDGIYTTTLSGMGIGSLITYKYRINATNNGREEFSNSTFVRDYLTLEGVNTVTDTYQKYLEVTSLAKPVEHNVSVYPVPAAKELFIEFELGIAGKIDYTITDLVGVERLSSSFVPDAVVGQHILSCEELPSGVYMLTVAYNGTKEVFKIVLQK